MTAKVGDKMSVQRQIAAGEIREGVGMAAVTGWIPLTGDRWIPECAFSMLFNTCRCSATTDKSTERWRSKSTEPSESVPSNCWPPVGSIYGEREKVLLSSGERRPG